ncbi:hypothetical protein Lal_00021353 [Lupinus albus]|nr:hypothetical protein Lal_00021353 [Lupinus albus]
MPLREEFSAKRLEGTPSEDIGWHFRAQVPEHRNNIKSKLCRKVIKRGITRLKQHIAHYKGQVTGCPRVTGVDSRLSESFSPGRERLTWEGEILGYTGGFSPERELSRLGEKWHFGTVETERFSLEREGLI